MKEILNKTDNSCKIICITGGIGQGKSLAMSVLANMLHLKTNYCIFANYNLKNSYRTSELDLEEKINDKIICIDELMTVISFSPYKLNDLFNRSISQSNIIIFTVHSLIQLPKSIRKEIDVILSVQKTDDVIVLSGENVKFKKEINIQENQNLYNSFEAIKTI